MLTTENEGMVDINVKFVVLICYTPPAMQNPTTTSRAQPLPLSASQESQVYSLFALAMAVTAIGIFVGMQYAVAVLSSGLHFVFLIAELGLIFTARLWMDKYPLNYFL